MVCDQSTVTDVAVDLASDDDVATRQRNGYRAAIELMIARYRTPIAEVDDDTVPPGLAPGLAELCTRLLDRYERLSAMNRYAEPAVGPLEHLRLLALLDDHRIGQPAPTDAV